MFSSLALHGHERTGFPVQHQNIGPSTVTDQSEQGLTVISASGYQVVDTKASDTIFKILSHASLISWSPGVLPSDLLVA